MLGLIFDVGIGHCDQLGHGYHAPLYLFDVMLGLFLVLDAYTTSWDWCLCWWLVLLYMPTRHGCMYATLLHCKMVTWILCGDIYFLCHWIGIGLYHLCIAKRLFYNDILYASVWFPCDYMIAIYAWLVVGCSGWVMPGISGCCGWYLGYDWIVCPIARMRWWWIVIFLFGWTLGWWI